MSGTATARRAERLRALHHGPDLLLLANVWDPLGARLVASMGFPAVATASASIAFSLGYDDGERITFDAMVEAIGRVARAVDLPVTADIESGFAADADALERNVRRVIEAGAVGVNLEDTDHAAGALYPLDVQRDRLRAARAAGEALGVPLVINARTDAFLHPGDASPAERLAEAIRRGRAFAECGADCFYPITVGDVDRLARIVREVPLPVNVYAGPSAAPLAELAAAGVRRVSVGPGLMRAAVTGMRDALVALRDRASTAPFTTDAMSSDEIRAVVSPERMEEG